jgi:hypothetical protein
MTVGTMAIISVNTSCDGIFQVKHGRKLSGPLSLVKVESRDESARSLGFRFFKPLKFKTASSRYMDEGCATEPDSFREGEGEDWFSLHEFPTDEDIAGITIVAWDVDEADVVPLPLSEYRKALPTIAAIMKQQQEERRKSS